MVSESILLSIIIYLLIIIISYQHSPPLPPHRVSESMHLRSIDGRCGAGKKHRRVVCGDPSSPRDDRLCDPPMRPAGTALCHIPCPPVTTTTQRPMDLQRIDYYKDNDMVGLFYLINKKNVKKIKTIWFFFFFLDK